MSSSYKKDLKPPVKNITLYTVHCKPYMLHKIEESQTNLSLKMMIKELSKLVLKKCFYLLSIKSKNRE